MQKVVGFLKGWLVTAIFSMAFAAMGWIEIGADFAFAHILVPIIMGFLIWLMIYISCLVVWVVVLLATGLLFFSSDKVLPANVREVIAIELAPIPIALINDLLLL